MEITPSNLAALRTRYNQVYQQAFLKQDVIWPKMAQLITSLAESETHVWLDRIPQLRKWSGDRVVQNASLRTYQLTNVPYELTMGLDRYKVEDNKINAFQPVVQQMAMQAKKWPDTLFFDSVNGVLAQGINVNTYD